MDKAWGFIGLMLESWFDVFAPTFVVYSMVED